MSAGVKKCAREDCGKTVYPLEELKCLDKVWHKMCFKCTVCGMVLTMKNYRGYQKMPYCEPHYPRTVASSVGLDTPEMQRIKENTKNQSQIAYHAEYEKTRGTKIDIADDPEISRHVKNSTVQSQAIYHGEKERKAHMEQIRPAVQEAAQASAEALARLSFYDPDARSDTGVRRTAANGGTNGVSSSNDGQSPYSLRHASAAITTVVYGSEPVQNGEAPARAVGSIADYDPMNGQWGSVHNGSKKAGAPAPSVIVPQQPVAQTQLPQQQTPNRPGAVSPVKSAALSPSGGARATSGRAAKAGFVVRAIYDYTAADKDEVSFQEGDTIVNCEKVDEGWMTGTVQRTLQWGMLPANYVELVKTSTGLHRLS